MLWNTLIRYSTQQHSAQLEMKEQREDEAEKTSFLVDKALSTMEKNLVMEKKLFSPYFSHCATIT